MSKEIIKFENVTKVFGTGEGTYNAVDDVSFTINEGEFVVILGAPFAKPMLEAMMNSNGDNFDYYATVKPLGYITAAIIVMAVSMAVSLMFTKKIRKLDMVESLKGAE